MRLARPGVDGPSRTATATVDFHPAARMVTGVLSICRLAAAGMHDTSCRMTVYGSIFVFKA
jgi:hypothetical protein